MNAHDIVVEITSCTESTSYVLVHRIFSKNDKNNLELIADMTGIGVVLRSATKVFIRSNGETQITS